MQTNQIEAATKLWNEKIKSNSNHINLGSLTNTITRKNDVELGKAFLEMIKTKENVSPGVLGIAYGTIISVLSKWK